MKSILTPHEALARLEDLCARSEQCRHDIRQKLHRWGVDAQAHDAIICRLEQLNFVDDGRFAAAYVRDKYRIDRWGRMKIVSGLTAKRIERHHIDTALNEIDSKEYAANCYRMLKAKRNDLLRTVTDDYELRQRLLRHGASRGYEARLIVRLLDNDRLWS